MDVQTLPQKPASLWSWGGPRFSSSPRSHLSQVKATHRPFLLTFYACHCGEERAAGWLFCLVCLVWLASLVWLGGWFYRSGWLVWWVWLASLCVWSGWLGWLAGFHKGLHAPLAGATPVPKTEPLREDPRERPPLVTLP